MDLMACAGPLTDGRMDSSGVPNDLAFSCRFSLQIQDENKLALNREQSASVTFTNPFSHPVSGVLSVSGAGLLQGHANFK